MFTKERRNPGDVEISREIFMDVLTDL